MCAAPSRRLLQKLPVNGRQSANLTNFVAASQRECKEVRIPVPWGGTIAAKWWGPRNVRPILALHGWQDNAGTFDTLAPLLPAHIGILAIDLPGHGMSSWIPDGMGYHNSDYMSLVWHIADLYGWEKISIMGHSMSALIVFVLSALYPEKLDFVISLDALKPHIRDSAILLNMLRSGFADFQVADKRNREQSQPPSYPYDELVERLNRGTHGSVEREVCPHLLERSVKKVEQIEPDEPERYYFARDNRVKFFNNFFFSQETCLEMARSINIPYLFIKASDSPYYEQKLYYEECLQVMQENKLFEYHRVEGKHHVHLNEPTQVSGIISDFINRQRAPEATSKL